MAATVAGVVRDLGEAYADGTPRLEIHVPAERADGLPYQVDERVPVRVRIGGAEYEAGLRATKGNKYVWVSPDVYATDGERLTLGRVLTDAGFHANQPVRLEVDGATITVS